ncbi:MAG: MopE-related protein [bacterium]
MVHGSRWCITLAVALLATGCFDDDEPEPGDAAPDAAPAECTTGETRPCFVRDACTGRQSCVDGAFGACVAPIERCDGTDDDCDGMVDEGFAGLGDPCEDGAGPCLDRGRIVCAPGGTVVICDARAGDGTAEACDGIDNDCDGDTDEGIVIDEPCDTGRRGVCGVGVASCVDGDTRCQPVAEATAETCDGRDEDCDGRVDEAEAGGPIVVTCYDGLGDTAGVGACRAGQRTCADGALGACLGQITPAEEACNAVDDDCDGATDEGIDCACPPGAVEPCYSGPDGTAGVGICRVGARTCPPDGRAWGACDGEIVPAIEACNGIDDDCDGEIDDAEGIGRPCSVGVGACLARGDRVCDRALGRVVCSAAEGAPSEEICDGEDNDCDGFVDDLPGAGEPCAAGEGACLARGVLRCGDDDPALACSATPLEPDTERCNGRDDDCNGRVDDVVGLGDDCAVGAGICRSTGFTVCDLAAEALVCGAVARPAGFEICLSRADEDCDGAVDEEPCTIPCAGDGDCPAGRICLVDACVPGCREDDECPDEARCEGAACVPRACGDGRLDAGEACDDGNRESGDGCDRDCGLDRFEIITGVARFDDQGFGVGGGDDYLFTADGPSRLWVEASDGADGCPADLQAWLYDDAGVELAAGDDEGPGACPGLAIAVDAGLHRLRVEARGGAPAAGYRLDLRLARELGAGGVFDGAFPAGGDDLYALDLERPADVTFEVRDPDGECADSARARLTLLDAALALISSDDGAPGDCARITTRLEAGTWHLRVADAADRDPLAYALTAAIDPAAEPIDTCRLQAPPAVELAPGEVATVSGRLYQRGRTDRTRGNDPFPGLRAELGHGPDGSDPAVDPRWLWIPGEPTPGWDGPAAGERDLDEYRAELRLPDPAPALQRRVDYAWRFSADDGRSWTVCDLDGNGATLTPPAGGYTPARSGDAVTGRAVVDCRDACADIFACGAQGDYPDPATCVFECARSPGFYQNARCFADRIDRPPPPPTA